MSSIQTAEKEVIRQEILQMLSMTGAEGASGRVLKAALKKEGHDLEEAEIVRQLSYLQDKGLVRMVQVKNPQLGIRRTVAYITAAGTDYLEGNGGEIPGIDEG